MDHNQYNSSAISVRTFLMTWDYDCYGNSSKVPLKAYTWDSGYNIRHSIFLLSGLCVGLPLIVWALGFLRHHKLSGRGTSVFIFALLLTDLLEIAVSPALLTYLLVPDVTGSCPVFQLFFGVKYCGLHLHQMVALQGVMARTYLPLTFPGLWRRLSILVCLIESLFLLLCLYVHPFAQTTTVTFCWLLAAVIILGVTCKLTFTPTTSPSESTVTVQEEDHMVLTVATLSFFMLYGPFLAFEFAQASIPAASSERHASGILTAMAVVHPAVCLRLIVDPLLCFLVIRQLPLDRPGQEPASDNN